MTEMIERVARAMHERALSEGWSGPSWENMPHDSYQQALGLARAAIAAMRDPSEEQYDALCATNKSWRELDSYTVWTTYIDAALKGGLGMTEKERMTDTGPITREEMVELFGEYMPIKAVNLIWNSSGSKTISEVRAELRKIGAQRTRF